MKPGKRSAQKPTPRFGFLPLATVFDSLSKAAHTDGIDAHAVQKALNLRSLFLAQRLLVALAGSDRGFATAEEFVAVAEKLMAAPAAAKVEFLFRLHDVNGDGWISRDELERLLHIGLAENNLRLSDGQVDQLIGAVMLGADQNGDGRISKTEFFQLMIAHPVVERRLADYGVSLLMPGKRARAMTRLPGGVFAGWVRSGFVLGAWIAVYVGINAALFVHAFLHYRAAGSNINVQLARGCGACLNLNGALIVVPMFRRTLTWIRESVFGWVVPADDAVNLHGLVGGVMMLFGVVHSGAHVLNTWPTFAAMVASPWTRTSQTGMALLAVIAVMWVMSRSFVRRSGHFELFHLTHLGYIAVVPLLFLHGPVFWIWGTAPWAWYLVERTLRARRRWGKSRILSANGLAAEVTALEFERPDGFDYAPGDYIFLCVPAVARHEWHPFTLTSAPEDKSRLSVHIRSVGNWTSAVHERVPELLEWGEEPVVHIDGPYGTASREILDAPHAVTIAAGIGVTPFASILQSLMLRQNDPDAPALPLQKLRFVWLSRDQYSFEWFRDLLATMETQDRHNLMDIRIFMTGGRSDMAGGLLDVAQYLLRRQKRGDIVTGLKSHTTMGAPDFDLLLEEFYRIPNLPRPKVFFCGPAPLGRKVAKTCRRLGLRFRKERF